MPVKVATKEENTEVQDVIDSLLAKRQMQKIAEVLMDEIDDLRSKWRSMNAKISRLKRIIEEEAPEEYDLPHEFEDMPVSLKVPLEPGQTLTEDQIRTLIRRQRG